MTKAMAMLNPLKTCLLITDINFYFFKTVLVKGLAEMGYTVEVINDLYPKNLVGRVLGKLQSPLAFRSTRRYISTRYLNGKKYDLVLIIRGKSIDEELIAELRKSAENVVGYNWDNFEANPAPLRWYNKVSRYTTFDYVDAEKCNVPVVELFSHYPPENDSIKNIEVSAVGRNYPDRLKYIDAVLQKLKPASTFIRLYESNVVEYLLHLLINPRLFFKYRKFISLRPLSNEAYFETLRSSSFVIDFAHQSQTGLTMRSFEAVAMKTVIITNNSFITRSKNIHPGNYLVYQQGDDEKKFTDQFKNFTPVYSATVRSVHDFLNELIA